MTAEIAILNKSAVALASDSAVTISAGEAEEKIFDSADKLFELCLHNPIGVMSYNGTDLMGIPLSILIKEFRENCRDFKTVKEVAYEFLDFLFKSGRGASARTQKKAVSRVIDPILENLRDDYREKFFDKMTEWLEKTEEDIDFAAMPNEVLNECISKIAPALAKRKNAYFVGTKSGIRFLKKDEKIINEIIEK